MNRNALPLTWSLCATPVLVASSGYAAPTASETQPTNERLRAGPSMPLPPSQSPLPGQPSGGSSQVAPPQPTFTPLMIAAEQGNLAEVGRLISLVKPHERIAFVAVTNNYSEDAAQLAFQRGHLAVVNRLLSFGATPRFMHGMSALERIALAGDAAKVTAALKDKASTRTAAELSRVLGLAAAHRSEAMVRALLKYFARGQGRSAWLPFDGEALQVAALNNHDEVVTYLLGFAPKDGWPQRAMAQTLRNAAQHGNSKLLQR